MGLFRRKSSNNTEAPQKEKGAWRKPANTAFKQQRLKAWQPILTPRTVLPTLFIIALVFAPIGGLLVWGSNQVSEIRLNYSQCENQPAANSMQSLTFSDLPSNAYEYNARSSDSDAAAKVTKPRYAFFTNSSAPLGKRRQCILEFDVPANMESTVLFYYRLTNFYQNHRRYVKSLDADQLKGKLVSASTLNDGNCKPLDQLNGKVIYPCGLIANSLFNDTYSPLQFLNPPDGAPPTYTFSEKGIAWPGEKKKYTNTPGYNLTEITPPPNWIDRFPNGYTEQNPPPDFTQDEHFQNWMRTAGLPTFSKLWGRNEQDTLQKGRYRMTIDLNYPVLPYKGTKSIVITTVSWIGGKNPFLGWAYVAAAGLFVALAIAGTAWHLVKPRRLGDMSLLSWNR